MYQLRVEGMGIAVMGYLQTDRGLSPTLGKSVGPIPERREVGSGDAPPHTWPYTRYPKIPTSLTEREFNSIALARHIEEAVDSGQFESLAAIARACRVSRARVS
jgi:hypothetical protein